MSTALVPVSQIESLPAEYREHAVTAYLANARDRLADALEATGPHAVAQIKAEVATVAEMTKQLNLSKECRDDSTEMVRRAEYALGKAIRKGQEEGTVRTLGSNSGPRSDYMRNGRLVRVPHRDVTSSSISPKDIEPDSYARVDIYAMADNATEEEFEDALTEARAEGNLSRSNVVRKVKQQASPQTRDERAAQVESLAREGHTRRQIAAKVGISERTVQQIIADYSIDVPADRLGKRRRIDANRVLSGAAESVSAAAYSLQQINPLDLDKDEAQEWVDSLTESLTALRKALNPIKESLQ